MKPTTEYIEEYLPGLWEEVKSTDHGNLDMDALIEFYKGVISEMMKGYAEEILEEVERNSNMYMRVIDGPEEIGTAIVVDERFWDKLKEKLV